MDDRRIRLSDNTISALCGSGVARHVLHPLEGDATPLDDIDTSVLASNAEALLTGRAPVAMRRIGRALLNASPRRLPPGFPELLTHAGIDPKGMLILALIIPNDVVTAVRGLEDDAVDVAQLGFHGRDFTWIALAPGDHETAGVSWREDHLMIPRLPESVAATLVGMPLSTIIEHPALDPLGITITAAWDCFDDERYIEVTTSLHSAREADLAITHARVVEAFGRIAATDTGLDGVEVDMLAGGTLAYIMEGHVARFGGLPKIGINTELVRLHDDAALEKLLREQIIEWKRKTA